MSLKSRAAMGGYVAESRNSLPQKLVILLCVGSFFTGMFFTNRMWMVHERKGVASKVGSRGGRIMMDNDQKQVTQHESNHIPGVFSAEEYAMKTLKKTISKLELELATAKTAQETILNGSPISGSVRMAEIATKRKYLVVIGINTAFNSRKRRDSVRATWMPQGDGRKKLEEEKGIVIRFVIGHSMNGVPYVDLSLMSLVSIIRTLPANSTAGGILDRAIEAEEKKHGDFLRLEHVEGYTELSAKTKQYFATAVGLWDADFYVKVDDDVHVNIGTLGMTLAQYRLKPRVYIGCMKSGPILAQKGVRYHEPEHWKFGGEGNKYFRHATGQLYAISRDLAIYIAINQHLLHRYANEDVSLGAWLIGLDVSHIDDKRLCCGTPPDCEWKAQAGNICVASFDWNCSGICQSDERIFEVHQRCSEEKNAIWNASF